LHYQSRRLTTPLTNNRKHVKKNKDTEKSKYSPAQLEGFEQLINLPRPKRWQKRGRGEKSFTTAKMAKATQPVASPKLVADAHLENARCELMNIDSSTSEMVLGAYGNTKSQESPIVESGIRYGPSTSPPSFPEPQETAHPPPKCSFKGNDIEEMAICYG
jgi:hypothetical protein